MMRQETFVRTRITIATASLRLLSVVQAAPVNQTYGKIPCMVSHPISGAVQLEIGITPLSGQPYRGRVIEKLSKWWDTDRWTGI